MPASHIKLPVEFKFLCFQASFLGRQEMLTWELRPSLSLRKTTSGFCLAQTWILQMLGNWIHRWKILSRSPSIHMSFCLLNKEVSVMTANEFPRLVHYLLFPQIFCCDAWIECTDGGLMCVFNKNYIDDDK